MPKRPLNAPFADVRTGQAAAAAASSFRKSVRPRPSVRPSVVGVGVAKVIKAAAALKSASLSASESGHPAIPSVRSCVENNKAARKLQAGELVQGSFVAELFT